MSYPKSSFSQYSVSWATRTEAEPLIMSHYLKCWPGVVVGIVGMWRGPFLVGVVVFALPPRETAVRYKVPVVWELARLYVMDSEPFNSESWLISRAIKWVKKHRPDVGALVSYADPSAGHKGTIYRASNWVYDGKTDQERKTPRFDYVAAGRKYSRRSHVPIGEEVGRVPRVSKFRFVYRLLRLQPEARERVVRGEQDTNHQARIFYR